MTHLVGQQLGRYLIQEEIGRGGMARVYRALDTTLKRTVALKVLAPQLAVDPEFAQRFEREAVTAANLRHPNIVTIFDVGEQNGTRYIAMEYVSGRTLHAIIEERGALGLGYAISIVGPVAAALDYAHSQGSVHRDIKPQNIMIDADGRVLLADFGIAQAPEGSGERLTRTGIFMGTPEYISPEQASAQRVDGRSDLYSLGIATYEAITGVVPFAGATPQLIVAHAQTPPPPPSSIDPAQPPELDLVMGRILAKRPESRFASGMAFVEGLRVVARKHGVAVATTPQVAELVQPRSTSAGQSTVSLGRGQTPFAAPAPILPPPRPRPAPEPAPESTNSDPTQIGAAPRGAAPNRSAPPARSPLADPPRARTASPPAPRRYEGAGDDGRPPRRPPPRGGYGGARDSSPRAWIIGGLLGGLFLVLLIVLWRTVGPAAPPPITFTRVPVDTPFPTQVTASPTDTPPPTEAPVATATAPSVRGSAVPVPPTDPPAPPPTDPPAPPPTDPPAPPPTIEPTAEVFPTVEPTVEVIPTVEPTAEITPTVEPPPTEAATSPPEPTATTEAAAASPSPLASATAIVSPAPTPSAAPSATPITPTLTSPPASALPTVVATATATATITSTATVSPTATTGP